MFGGQKHAAKCDRDTNAGVAFACQCPVAAEHGMVVVVALFMVYGMGYIFV